MSGLNKDHCNTDDKLLMHFLSVYDGQRILTSASQMITQMSASYLYHFIAIKACQTARRRRP